MDFSFFTTNNKSGYKTTEKWLSKNHFELYQEIINYSKNLGLNLNFKEKIWFYFNKLTKRPECVTCGGEIKFRNRFDKPYGEFCSLKCINNNKEEMIFRQKSTFNKKYNIDFYPQHKDFIKKQKQTKLKKYGNENYVNILKLKQTKLKKYGDENFNNHKKYIITCLNKYNTTNYSKSNSYINKIDKDFKQRYPELNILSINKKEIKIKCEKCNKEYSLTKQLLYERYKRGYDVCVFCNPIYQSHQSGYEREISEFLKLLNINHKCSDRETIKKEIDIFIPSHKLGIEINGVFWHNELFVYPEYHLEKTIECQLLDIELIHIFEDEWLYKKEIVKSIIKNRLGLNKNTIYGRKCVIKEINSNMSKQFLNDNHIQGNVNSKVRLGLFYDKMLVSVMTFSRGRILMGGKKNEWELTRFSNLINTNVVGASSKLLKYFIKNYNPEKIVSYSDIRIFNGEMYKKLGFVKKSQSKPNYWYVVKGIRQHRFKYRKSVLIKEGFNPNESERKIMFNRKIYRIYDCGNIRWEYFV